jgi:hypothetical protein
MKARHVGLGVKFGGNCLVCGRPTGNSYEMASTSLYKLDNGKFGVVHPRCAGGSTKNACGGGGVKYKTEPASVIEVGA